MKIFDMVLGCSLDQSGLPLWLFKLAHCHAPPVLAPTYAMAASHCAVARPGLVLANQYKLTIWHAG